MDEENQDQNQTENQNPPQNEKTEKFNTTVVAVVMAVLVLAVGVFLIATNKKTGDQSADLNSTQKQEQITQTESSPASQSTGTNQAVSASQPISVEGGGFYFKPNQIKVKKGQKVTIVFNSVGGSHDFVIDELDVKAPLTAAGKSSTVEFTPETSGSFEFYCSVGNHRAQGMQGTLIVE